MFYTFSILLPLLMTTPLAPATPPTDKFVLHYVERQPDRKSDNTPVIILLHGVGSNENDLFGLASRLPAHYRVLSVRAPFMLGHDAYGWYQVDFSSGKPVINAAQAAQSKSILSTFIDQVIEHYHIQDHNITLMGFSQGAIMSYTMALTHPEKVKAIVALSGRILPEFDNQISKTLHTRKPRIFIGHGLYDTVLPVHHARESATKLKHLSLQPEVHEYPVDHSISEGELKDVVEWLR